MNEYVKNQIEFDEILQQNFDFFKGGKNKYNDDEYMQALELEEINSLGKLSEQKAAQYVRQKERELMGLDKTVSRSGFITF